MASFFACSGTCHNYLGHNYLDYTYIRHDFIRHDYTRHSYIRHNYIRQHSAGQFLCSGTCRPAMDIDMRVGVCVGMRGDMCGECV